MLFRSVGFEGQVTGSFIGQQSADFLSELAEILRANVSAAHKAEFVTDQRVAYLTDRHREKTPGAGKKTGLD